MKTKISLVSVMMLVVCFVPLKNSGQEVLTRGEVYDFEVGDIFHYRWTAGVYEGQGSDSFTNITILDKFYSPGEDTVYYARDIATKEVYYPNPNWEYHFYIDTIFYTNLDTFLSGIDYVYVNPTSYNGRTINVKYDTTIYDSIIAETETWKWAEGCSMVYYRGEFIEYNAFSFNRLLYYNKGGEEWGTPAIITGVNENNEYLSNISISPNPATSFITIQLKEGIAIEEAIIYNHLGQKALVAVPVNNTVDVSGLRPGIYFIEVATKEWRGSTKLIIE